MVKPMEKYDPRAALERLIADRRDDYAGLSKMLGRNPAYVQQFIKRGSPKRLPERERSLLARYFGVDERVLGAPPAAQGRASMRKVPKLDIAASAGGGAFANGEQLAGRVDFNEDWLRKMGADPAYVSLIRVKGDSMEPTLNDGDDIMVDERAATRALKAGIHVIRMEDQLYVKRLKPGQGGRLSVLSDNEAHPSWPDMDAKHVTIVGRVIWVGREL